MKTLENITKNARLKSKPSNISGTAWSNAMNWTIEAWKCELRGQKWVHSFEICCPEQYYLLLDETGRFILSDVNDLNFTDSPAMNKWAVKLESQIADMRSKNEWVESLRWAKLLGLINENLKTTPNEDAFIKSKKVVKGHRLIRIKSAA